MYRRLIAVFFVLGLALMPLGTSAQPVHRFSVQAFGDLTTNDYYFSSEMCETGQGAGWIRRGGGTFRASGISPASGGVFETVDAIGGMGFGNTYFYGEGNDAFQFWFEGKFSCRTSSDGPLNAQLQGQWTFGFSYSLDPSTGELMCTELTGSGNALIMIDFAREKTSTYLSGSYTVGETEPCP